MITVEVLLHNKIIFTYQRKGSQESQIQAFTNIAADLHKQIDNITFGSGGGDPNEPIIGIV